MFENRPPMPWRDEPSPWRDPADLETRPQLVDPLPPPTPALPARRRRGTDGLALVLVGAVVGGLVGVGGARAIAPQIFPTAVASARASASTTTATDPATQAAIKDVIQKANAAQAAAFAKSDPTLMQATSTAAHYGEMMRINSDLAAGGVTGIALTNITFGGITVDGSNATATATETWTSTFADGSADKSSDQNDYTLVLAGGVWKISANTQPNAAPGGGTGTTIPTPAPNPQAPRSGAVQSTSRNWSGYVATGGAYSSVTGTWVIAKPDPKTPGIDATWVGIGGANTTDLIQAGTEAMVNPDGTITYDAWTETLPQSTRNVTVTVNAGDTVTVTLTERSAGSWLIEMKNVTTKKTYTTTLGYNSSKSSAEWIQEAPSVGRGIARLDSFGTVTFSGASAVIDGKKQTLKNTGAKPVTMTNGSSQALAVPTAIGDDGSSFTVDRTSTPSTGGASGRRRG